MADAALVATLLPAMARVEPLQLEAPVSARLLSSVPTIQQVLVSWSRQSEVMRGLDPVFRPVAVEAVERTAPEEAAPRGAATFFSGGVDSFYTALKHRHEHLTLVFVHGLDVPLDNRAQRELVANGVRHAATELGLPFLEVETNVRAFSDVYVSWLDSHGAAVASVAMLLGRWFERVYVPGTDTYATLVPLGSHPLLDPLWSTERVEIVHDGCEAHRLDKLLAIKDCSVAHESLRVCVDQDFDGYNCGHCWKCVRTMVGLRVLGISDRFATLPDLDQTSLARRVAWSDTGGESVRTWERHRGIWKPYLRAATLKPERDRLARALAIRFAWSQLQKNATRATQMARTRLAALWNRRRHGAGTE